MGKRKSRMSKLLPKLEVIFTCPFCDHKSVECDLDFKLRVGEAKCWTCKETKYLRVLSDFTDADWLDAAFYFYDEKAQLVKIRVRDCLDSKAQMRYEYEDVPNLWINTPPTVSEATLQKRQRKAAALAEFPVMLNSPVTALVKRPTEEDKKAEEALVIDGIEVDENVFAKFDVFVNVPEHEQVGAGGRELAGSFVMLPHDHKMKSRIRLGLSLLLKDLKAEDDESMLVTLVPRSGKGKVKVDGIHIEYID